MTEREKTLLEANLTGALEKWWEAMPVDVRSLPIVGENMVALMAKAALVPLYAVKDAVYLKSEGMFDQEGSS